jgi:hypothetical protein
MRPVIDTAQSLDFPSMSMAELQAEALALAEVLTMCNDQRQAIFATMNARKASVKARAAVAGMNELEVEALANVVAPEAVASAEAAAVALKVR